MGANGASGGTDTAVTGAAAAPSSDGRTLVGAVHGIGGKPDTTKYELVGGATVVLSLPDGGAELVRTVARANGPTPSARSSRASTTCG